MGRPRSVLRLKLVHTPLALGQRASPQNSCSLGTSECGLHLERGFCRCNQVKVRSHWITVSPKSNRWCPRIGDFGPTCPEERDRKGHVTTGPRNTRDCRGPPKARGMARSFSLRLFRKTRWHQHLDFRLRPSQTMRVKFCLSGSPKFMVIC